MLTADAAVALSVALSIVWSCPLPVNAAAVEACAGPARIVPGAAIGPVRIGMPLADIVSLLGPPSVVDRVASEDPRQWRALAAERASRVASLAEASTGWAAAFYDSGPNAGLRLYAWNGRLARITLDATAHGARLRNCATKEGIRLGSPAQAVRHAYGPAEYGASYSWDAYWIYDSRGLFVRTARPGLAGDEAVISITVFAPSGFCQVALSDPRKISPRLCP
jgi:hypothetical protein